TSLPLAGNRALRPLAPSLPSSRRGPIFMSSGGRLSMSPDSSVGAVPPVTTATPAPPAPPRRALHRAPVARGRPRLAPGQPARHHADRGGGMTGSASGSRGGDRVTGARSWRRAGARAVAALLGASVLALAARAGAAELVIRNARLFDATGAAARDGVTITVRDGVIVAIGDPVAVGDDATVIDASGMTVLPGLIDAHVHLAAAPGGAIRGDSPAELNALNQQHLRAYLANGVTTILDPGSPLAPVEAAQRWLAAGNPGPRYLTTGPMLRVPGSYGAEEHGELRTPADVEAALDRLQAIGGVGVKLTTEHGFLPFGSLPQYPPEIRDAIVAGAKRRGLPLYVHAMSDPDAQAALDLGAHAIMHAPMGGAWVGAFLGTDDLSDAYVARLKESGAYQLSTLSVMDTWPGHYDRARLDDPLVQLTVPTAELTTARDADAERLFAVRV